MNDVKYLKEMIPVEGGEEVCARVVAKLSFFRKQQLWFHVFKEEGREGLLLRQFVIRNVSMDHLDFIKDICWNNRQCVNFLSALEMQKNHQNVPRILEEFIQRVFPRLKEDGLYWDVCKKVRKLRGRQVIQPYIKKFIENPSYNSMSLSDINDFWVQGFSREALACGFGYGHVKDKLMHMGNKLHQFKTNLSSCIPDTHLQVATLALTHAVNSLKIVFDRKKRKEDQAAIEFQKLDGSDVSGLFIDYHDLPTPEARVNKLKEWFAMSDVDQTVEIIRQAAEIRDRLRGKEDQSDRVIIAGKIKAAHTFRPSVAKAAIKDLFGSKGRQVIER